MRVSSNQAQQQGINSILDQQARINKTQLQISSGKRLNSAADDPVSAARVSELEDSVRLVQQFGENANMARDRLALTESVLEDFTNITRRVRELALQGNNATQSAETRALIAVELRALLQESVDLTNSRDASGEYLFAGSSTGVQPFSLDATGAVSYNGGDTYNEIQVGLQTRIRVNDPGSDIFSRLRSGNGTFNVATATTNTGTGSISAGNITDRSAYAADNYRIVFTSATTFDVMDETLGSTLLSNQAYIAGAAIRFNGIETSIKGMPASGDSFTVVPAAQQDVFSIIQNITRLYSDKTVQPANSGYFQTEVERILTELDTAESHIVSSRADIGTRMNSIDNQSELNEANAFQLTHTISMLQDLDYAEASSRLSLQLTVLQAAQQAFIRVQDLSLFKLLR